jgi:hypothetical protein
MDYFNKLRNLIGGAAQAVGGAVQQVANSAPVKFGENLVGQFTNAVQQHPPTEFLNELAGGRINTPLPTPNLNSPYYNILQKLAPVQQNYAQPYVQNTLNAPIQNIGHEMQFQQNPNASYFDKFGSRLNMAMNAGMLIPEVATANNAWNGGMSALQANRLGTNKAQGFAQGFVGTNKPGLGTALTDDPNMQFLGNMAGVPLSMIAMNPKGAISGVKGLYKGSKVASELAGDLSAFAGQTGGIQLGPKIRKVGQYATEAENLISNPVIPVENPRGFLKTVENSPKSTEPLMQQAEQVNPQTYVPITNKDTVFSAKQVVDQSPDIARTRVFSNEPPSAEKTAIGIDLAKRYEHQKNYDEAVNVIEKLDKDLRESGRAIQAASLWNKLSPEGMLRAATRASEMVGKQLDPDFKSLILEKMGAIQKMPEGELKDKETMGLLNAIAHKLPPKLSEVFDSYRYQNMLSSPKTHIRNIYSNLFNTLITRPADLAFQGTYDILRHPFNPMARDASLLDVPRYVKVTA